jgi:hypothetical protein
MRLPVDMNLTPRWTAYLIEAGIEAVHWSALGPIDAPDREICAFAGLHGYVILTNDLDFPQILAHPWDSGPSVIVLRGEPLVREAKGQSLIRASEELVLGGG